MPPPSAIGSSPPMPERRRYLDALHALQEATATDADLCSPFVRALGMTGAAVSTLGPPLGSETIGASDPGAARLDELQLDLGEGPCWEALASRRPVLEPDVQGSASTSWPLARQAMHESGLGAVFAFPLVVASVDIGAVDLYSDTPRHLSTQQIDDATNLSRVLARQVLRRALLSLTESGEDAGAWDGQYSRRELHQATGMVIAQMGLSAADALLVLRGHAFATNRPVRDVANDVVERRLDFTPAR
nr:GAF and ANTAR domain-containing protein [Clavibacter capsici]